MEEYGSDDEYDGSSWRPLVHVRDLCLAFLAVLEAPADAVSGRSFNVVPENENYQIRDVAELVSRAVPDVEVTFADDSVSDPRSYRVDGSELYRAVPAFRPVWTVEKGIAQLLDTLGAESLSEEWSENACGSRKRPPAARAFTNFRPFAAGEADAGTGSAAPRDRGRSADPRAPGAAILLSTSLRNSVAMNLQRRPIGQKVHALSAQASIASPLAPQASILPHSHTSPFGNPGGNEPL